MVDVKEIIKNDKVLYAIAMTRGDTFRTVIGVTDVNGDPYVPKEGDTIRFACKKNYNDSECLIYKDIPYDTCILQLDPEDTKPMNQPDTYVFDIQITTANGDVHTFIKGKLKITEEVD
jgi:hypothetical protein